MGRARILLLLGLLLLSAVALPPAPAAATGEGIVRVSASVRTGLQWSSAGPDAVDIRSNASWKLVVTVDDGTETIEGSGSASNVALPDGARHYTILLD